MKRAALYIRVSTEEQARHGLSISDQRAALEAYAKTHSMTVVDIYEDAGISARKNYKKRPALLKLLADVEAQKIDIMISFCLSSLTGGFAMSATTTLCRRYLTETMLYGKLRRRITKRRRQLVV